MNLNPALKLPSKKTAFLAFFVLLVGGVLFFFAADYWKSSKPWYSRWQIDRFLKQQTGQSDFKADFNFKLAEDVGGLRTKVLNLETNYQLLATNSAKLAKEIQSLNRLILLQTEANRRQSQLSNRCHELEQTLVRIPEALTNLPASTLTNLDLMRKEAADLKIVVEPVSLPLQPLRDEIAALQKQRDANYEATAAQRRELAVLLKQMGLKSKDNGNTNAVELTPEQMAGLSNKLAEIRAALAPAQQQTVELSKAIADKNEALGEKLAGVAPQLRVLRALTNRIDSIEMLQASVAKAREEAAHALQDYQAKMKELGLDHIELAKRQAALAACQKEYAELRKKQEGLYKELVESRKLLAEKKSVLEAQQNGFAAQFRKKFEEAKTYGQMYVVLGQQLSVAKLLLKDGEAERRRAGLGIAMQAATFCGTYIENQWLAARICEGYVMPHIELADDSGRKTPVAKDGIYGQCIAIFRNAEETNNTVGILQLAVKNAKTQRSGDYARYMLMREYMQNGAHAEALETARQIKETNNYRWVVQHIPWLEQQVKRGK